jgi:taurine dioxygenase
LELEAGKGMGAIGVRPLAGDLSFGARIAGVTRENLGEEPVRQRLRSVFEERGMIVFEDIESSDRMQVALSEVFGPLKDHPLKSLVEVDSKAMPGVITIRTTPTSSIVEIDGERLINWQPWHFDHAYNNELNRAGVLRAITISPKGGATGFADGVQIYDDLDPALRAKAESLNVLYNLDLRYATQWFGLPKSFREIRAKDERALELARTLPRAIHPAVWTRHSGQKVMHLCAYGARGIEGQETPEGNALLCEVWDAVERTLKPYYHQWKPTDMLIWDNWRMLHKACGSDPEFERVMYRTTIKGDYGLGRWESAPPPSISAGGGH